MLDVIEETGDDLTIEVGTNVFASHVILGAFPFVRRILPKADYYARFGRLCHCGVFSVQRRSLYKI